MNEFSRTELLLGNAALTRLKSARIAVFGIGGVGGYVAEALARSGVGNFLLVDNDTVSITNLNRQIIALHSTIGRAKVDVMRERILDINPAAAVEVRKCFFLPENSAEFDFTQFDYVVDAVDTVSAKLQIIVSAKNAGVPVISSMGAGNKLNPAMFTVSDIYRTSVCPLARVIRRECKRRGIKDLKVVYSTEKPLRPLAPSGGDGGTDELQENSAPQNLPPPDKAASFKKAVPGSAAFVPSVAGLIIAGEVVRDLVKHCIIRG